jgi:hypothetical protein
MTRELNKYDRRINSYMTLRRAVGLIGLCLPVVLLAYSGAFHGGELESSISHYYYTDMRNLFVGALCAVGLFMFFYAGYSWVDDWTGNIAGLSAIIAAFFPTIPVNGSTEWYNNLHLPFAALLFVCFAFFSLFLFTQSKAGKIYKHDPCNEGYVFIGSENRTPRKRLRNMVYIICGFGIIACLVFMAVWIFVFKTDNNDNGLTYWLEFTALILFGISWLTKGEIPGFADLEKEKRDFEDKSMLMTEAIRLGYKWVNPNRCGLLKDK